MGGAPVRRAGAWINNQGGAVFQPPAYMDREFTLFTRFHEGRRVRILLSNFSNTRVLMTGFLRHYSRTKGRLIQRKNAQKGARKFSAFGPYKIGFQDVVRAVNTADNTGDHF